MVSAIIAHLDARDVCTLACVNRGLRRSLASASLSFTAASTAHIQFKRSELDQGAAQKALKAFLKRNASGVKALAIPAYAWDELKRGKDSNFLHGATRLQSLHLNLRHYNTLEERGVLPQSLTSLTYVGWSRSEQEHRIFDWAPLPRLVSLQELDMRPTQIGRVALDAQMASCFSRLLGLHICKGANMIDLYLYVDLGLRLPILTCLHLWDVTLEPGDVLEHMDWAAALPNLLSLHIKSARVGLHVLTSLPPMLVSSELCSIRCNDFRKCVHLKRLKVDGRRGLRALRPALLPASLEVLVVLSCGHIRLGKPLPQGLKNSGQCCQLH